MEKDNYILNVINEIKAVLGKNNYRKKRYNSDILWLNKKESMIEKNIIRVAIMGITSSGKSTLVNCLLGENILPVAIKPSSSIIITCSKGKKRQATIYFRDREPEILSGEKLNEKSIAYYADEELNPNNELSVSQIDVTTPSFLLDEDIHIIDSPGLDACDLEMHEKLTLEILLPTIDICVFLTTVKANSDEINAEKIRIVNEKDKQIILVQNMMDSVEEKFGKNGIVIEDKTAVLIKHRKRAQNLLRVAINGSNNDFKCKSDIEKAKKNLNNCEFEVIQISALNALRGIVQKNDDLYNESNIEGFIEAVKLSIKRVMPKINVYRGKSLVERINHIINTDRDIIQGSDIEYINALMNITTGDIDDIVSDFTMARKKISSKIKEIDKNVKEIINEINESKSEEVESYSKIVEKINNKNIYMENEIVNIVKECEEKKNELYKSFNLDIRFSYSLPSMDSNYIDVKHKYEERIKLIEKNGILNKGKRILSQIFDTEWGYEKEEYDEKVVDKDATILMVENICNQNRRKYMNVLWEWSAQYNKSINIFYSEVIKRTDEYEKKKGQKIELENIEDVILNLKAINKKLKINKNDKIDENAIDILDNGFKCDNKSKALIKDKQCNSCEVDDDGYNDNSYSVTNTQYNLYKLSIGIFEKNYLLVGNYIKQKCVEKINYKDNQVFWAWDLDACTTFISRICGIYLSKEQCQIIKKEGIYTIDNITIIYELCEKKIDLYMILKELKNNQYNMFIIFNGIQIGNSEKQVLESFILKQFVMENSIMMNFVIDSSKEFINANNIRELLLIVNKFKDKVISRFKNINNGYILINSKNPIYNMALIEGQEKEKFIISDYRDIKESLFKNPLSRGKEEKETLEEILKYFLD